MSGDLNRDAWLTMHSAVWGAFDWPRGEIIRFSGATPGRDDFGARGHVVATDAEGSWAIIEKLAANGQNVYVQVGAQHASAAGTQGRGKKVDVAALPALVVDLDVRSGVHSAGDKNPTIEEVDEWLADYPLGRPTLTVHTGGGLHAWYVFDTPLDPVSELGVEVRNRHKQWWKKRAELADRNIDAGVLADITRVLRPAGSLNFKASPLPVFVRERTDNRISASGVLSLLPQLDAATARAVKRAKTPGGATRVMKLDEHGAPALVEDRFALAVPVSEFCEAVFYAERISSDGISMPDADGMVSDRDAGRLFRGKNNEERVTWFSTTVQPGFGLDSQDHSHSSFNVLAHAIAGVERVGYTKAKKLVAAWEGHWDTDGFVTACQAAVSDVCREAFDMEKPSDVPPPPARQNLKSTPDQEPAIEEAVAHGAEAQLTPEAPSAVARLLDYADIEPQLSQAERTLAKIRERRNAAGAERRGAFDEALTLWAQTAHHGNRKQEAHNLAEVYAAGQSGDYERHGGDWSAHRILIPVAVRTWSFVCNGCGLVSSAKVRNPEPSGGKWTDDPMEQWNCSHPRCCYTAPTSALAEARALLPINVVRYEIHHDLEGQGCTGHVGTLPQATNTVSWRKVSALLPNHPHE